MVKTSASPSASDVKSWPEGHGTMQDHQTWAGADLAVTDSGAVGRSGGANSVGGVPAFGRIQTIRSFRSLFCNPDLVILKEGAPRTTAKHERLHQRPFGLNCVHQIMGGPGMKHLRKRDGS
jgi:hypothetical protein